MGGARCKLPLGATYPPGIMHHKFGDPDLYSCCQISAPSLTTYCTQNDCDWEERNALQWAEQQLDKFLQQKSVSFFGFCATKILHNWPIMDVAATVTERVLLRKKFRWDFAAMSIPQFWNCGETFPFHSFKTKTTQKHRNIVWETGECSLAGTNVFLWSQMKNTANNFASNLVAFIAGDLLVWVCRLMCGTSAAIYYSGTERKKIWKKDTRVRTLCNWDWCMCQVGLEVPLLYWYGHSTPR